MTLSIGQLLRENEDLRRRLEEAEDALRALRAGEVDAVLVEAGREQVFTLETADKPYRLLVEQVPQGAATLTADGAIIYCNRRFAELLRRPLHSLLGKPIGGFVAPESRPLLKPCCATVKPPRSRKRSYCSRLTARRCRCISASTLCRKAPSGCA